MNPTIKIEVRGERGAAAGMGVVNGFKDFSDDMLVVLVKEFFRLQQAAVKTPEAQGRTFEFKLGAVYNAEIDAWVLKMSGEVSVELSASCVGG